MEIETKIVKKVFAKKKVGRPSIYDPANLEQITKYALLGLTDDQIAPLFNTNIVTFNKWKKEIPGFYLALCKGRDEADANVAASLYNRALGYKQEAVKIFMPAGADAPVYAPYEENVAADTAAARIWLYNRRRVRSPEENVKWTEMVQNQISMRGQLDVNLTGAGISALLSAAKQVLPESDEDAS